MWCAMLIMKTMVVVMETVYTLYINTRLAVCKPVSKHKSSFVLKTEETRFRAARRHYTE